MRFYVDMSYRMSRKGYWQKHMMELQEETVEVMQQPEKYYAQASSGKLCIMMWWIMQGLAKFAKELGIHHEGMRFR